MKKHYGLIGNPLSHSFSAQYFQEKFLKEGFTDADYHLFPMADIGEIRNFIRTQSLSGFNVTIPYKSAILKVLDEISDTARETGAVNVVKCTYRNGELFLSGHNTDAPAFRSTMEKLPVSKGTKALVLGSGGASRAVTFALKTSGYDFKIVSRNPGEGKILYPEVTPAVLSDHLLIINTTPLGMYPDTGHCPALPYEAFTNRHIAYDLVYNPSQTLFLKKAKENGAMTINGLEMLHTQAELAWKIWQEF